MADTVDNGSKTAYARKTTQIDGQTACPTLELALNEAEQTYKWDRQQRNKPKRARRKS